jgi:hypothetical protein
MTKKAWIAIIGLLISFAALFGTVTKNQNETIARLEHNLEASKDTLESVKLKNNELLFDKQILIVEKKELYDELEISKSDIKTLEKALNSKISYITKLEASIKLKDTVWMKPDTVFVKDNQTIKKFAWKDEWVSISSSIFGDNIKDSKLTVDNLNVNVPVQLGLTNDYNFWIKTPNPYITFTEINSAVIDGSTFHEKEKRLHHGVYVGFGFNYGMFNKSWDFGPHFGYGFMLSF